LTLKKSKGSIFSTKPSQNAAKKLLQNNKMSKPALFKDVGKRLSDLFTKEFPSEKQENSVSWKGKTPNGVTVESNLTANADGSVVGKFAPTVTWKEYTDTLEINSTRDFKLEASVENKPVDGLKCTLGGNMKGDEHWGSLALTYKHSNFNTTGSIDYGQEKGITVKGSLVLGTPWSGANRVDFGGEVECLVGNDKPQLSVLNTKASYSNPEFDMAAFCLIKPSKSISDVGLSYFHKVNSDLSVGAEIAFDPNNTDKKPKLTLGSQYLFQKDTTMKFKFDTTGSLGLSYHQKLNDYAKFTLGATVDTNKLSEKNSVKYGFGLALSNF